MSLNEKDLIVDYDVDVPQIQKEVYISVENYLTNFFVESYKKYTDQRISEPIKHTHFYQEIKKNNQVTIESVVEKFVKKHLAIAGGSISDLAINKEFGTKFELKDIDLFISLEMLHQYILIKNISNRRFSVENEYDEMLHEIMVKSFGEDRLFKVSSENDKVETSYFEINSVVDMKSLKFKNVNIDFILDNNETIEDTVIKFDFSFRKFWFNGERVKTTKGAILDLKKKRLHTSNTKQSLRTLARGLKFEKKYNFIFKKFYKKLLMFEHIQNEINTSSLMNYISLLPDAGINFVIDKFEEYFENEILREGEVINHPLEKMINFLRIKDDYTEYELIEKLIFYRLENVPSYEKRYEKTIKKLIEWSMNANAGYYAENYIDHIIWSRGAPLSLHNDECIEDKKRKVQTKKTFSEKEKKDFNAYFILTNVMSKAGFSFFHNSSPIDYVLENEVHFWLYGDEMKVKIKEIDLNQGVFNKQSIRVGGKDLKVKTLLDIKRKLSVKNKFVDQKHKMATNEDVIELVQKTIGKKLEISEELNSLSLLIDLFDLKNQVANNEFKINDQDSVVDWIVEALAQKRELLKLFATEVSLASAFTLEDLIEGVRIDFTVILLFDKGMIDKLSKRNIISNFIYGRFFALRNLNEEKSELLIKKPMTPGPDNDPIFKIVTDSNGISREDDLINFIKENFKENIEVRYTKEMITPFWP